MKINEFSKLTGKLSVVQRYYFASDSLSCYLHKITKQGRQPPQSQQQSKLDTTKWAASCEKGPDDMTRDFE